MLIRQNLSQKKKDNEEQDDSASMKAELIEGIWLCTFREATVRIIRISKL